MSGYHSNHVETVQTIDPASGQVVEQTASTYNWLLASADGEDGHYHELLVEQVIGTGSCPITNIYSYGGHTRVQTITRDGVTLAQYAYDSQKRLSELNTPMGEYQHDYQYSYVPWTAYSDDPTLYPLMPRSTFDELTCNWTFFIASNNMTIQVQRIMPTRTETYGPFDVPALCTTNWYYPAGDPNVAQLKRVDHPDGTMDLYTYGTNLLHHTNVVYSGQASMDRSSVVDGTETISICGPIGELQSRQVIDIASGITTSQEVYSSFDSIGRPALVTYLDGTSVSYTYDCCNLSSTTDRDGVETDYTYDLLKRRIAETRYVAGLLGITTTYNYDAAGNLLSTTLTGTNRYTEFRLKCPTSGATLIIEFMTNTNIENEQKKRDFFEYLKGPPGFSDISVQAVAGALWQYQIFSEHADFASFNKSKAVAFIEFLEKRPSKTKSGKLSVVTRSNYIRRVKLFFTWLSGQPGYKSKILKSDVEYLRLSNQDAQIARCGTTKTMPTFDEVKKIIVNINVKNDVDSRDRALISLALITGMRISAMVSMKMKSYDEREKTIDQNPGDGVHTKNSNRILTTFFPIGWADPERHFREWYDYLKLKGFGPDDPIFPSTLSSFGDKGFECSKKSVGKSFWSSTGGARAVFKRRCVEANVPYFNPHLFRHFIISLMQKTMLTEEQKKAVSLTLGHEKVGTTFGAYGYGNMSKDDAIKIVQKLGTALGENRDKITISKEDWDVIQRVLKQFA